MFCYLGNASRLCNLSGEWEVADVKECWSFVYQELEQVQICELNSNISFFTLKDLVSAG